MSVLNQEHLDRLQIKVDAYEAFLSARRKHQLYELVSVSSQYESSYEEIKTEDLHPKGESICMNLQFQKDIYRETFSSDKSKSYTVKPGMINQSILSYDEILQKAFAVIKYNFIPIGTEELIVVGHYKVGNDIFVASVYRFEGFYGYCLFSSPTDLFN